MPITNATRFLAVLSSVALHGVVLSVVGNGLIPADEKPVAPKAEVLYLQALPKPPQVQRAPPPRTALHSQHPHWCRGPQLRRPCPPHHPKPHH